MSDWDTLRAKNEALLARPRFQWTDQRKRILCARAWELATGKTTSFAEFSDEWYRRQLRIMRKHLQVATDEELIAYAVEAGIIPAYPKDGAS